MYKVSYGTQVDVYTKTLEDAKQFIISETIILRHVGEEGTIAHSKVLTNMDNLEKEVKAITEKSLPWSSEVIACYTIEKE
jgi:hypothetical protein